MACDGWSNVTNITFEEVFTNQCDILVGSATGRANNFDGPSVDVRVRGQDAENLDFADLGGLVVGYREGSPVRLAAVADVALSRGPARIQRISQSRAAVVSASVVGRDLGTVSAEIENALTGVPLPADITFMWRGQRIYLPIATTLLLSAALTLIARLV